MQELTLNYMAKWDWFTIQTEIN